MGKMNAYYAIENCKCVGITDAAIKVKHNPDEDGEDFWVPKSALHEDNEVYDLGMSGTLIVREWVISDKDLYTIATEC